MFLERHPQGERADEAERFLREMAPETEEDGSFPSPKRKALEEYRRMLEGR